jgi:pimeloyl-ACP methyl ester carboxylesterase
MAEVKRVTLSYREATVGGEVRAKPEISDLIALEQAQHLVLLIHGYNNDAQDAKEAYDGFHARQFDLDPDGRYGLGRTFVEVYWPGDAAWGFASFLFYMGSIKHAIQSAERLADYLAGHLGKAVRIEIVAHSMGCRLATELLRALQNQPAAPEIARIVCMAGAVPTFMLAQRQPPQRLRPAYDQLLREGARSLYSGADPVLAFAFPAGQSLAPGAEGFMPTALGHEMWTDNTVPHNLGQQINPGAGHGDYWGWNTKPQPLACATRAAQEVRDYLQFPSAGSRAVENRVLMENNLQEARANGAEREVGARRLPIHW